MRWIVREEVEELALENCETGGTEPLTQTRGFVTTWNKEREGERGGERGSWRVLEK